MSKAASSATADTAALLAFCEKYGLGKDFVTSLRLQDFDDPSELTVLADDDISGLSSHLKLSYGKKAKLLKGISTLRRAEYASLPSTAAASPTGRGRYGFGAGASGGLKHSRESRLGIYERALASLPGKKSESESESDSAVRPTALRRTASTVEMLRADPSIGDPEKIRRLAEDNERLTRALLMSERALYSGGMGGGGVSTEKMSVDDISRVRTTFNQFDDIGDGEVEVEDFGEMMAHLGEPLTPKELGKVIAELDAEKKGQIRFGAFLSWWQRIHRGGKKGKRYRERFKFQTTLLDLSPDFLDKSTTDLKAYRRPSFNLKKLIAKHVGKRASPEFRVVFHYEQEDGKLTQVSPWHDIPLVADSSAETYHFVCEIPKWTRAKFEIATGEPFNPIKQDMKHGKLRYYQWGDMMFNYGAFPQTWEDPSHSPEDTGMPGDNDPIDVIEIGTRQLATGSVTPVKVLGVLALLDSGETDWKVLAINAADPLSKILVDVHDVEKHMPGAIDAIREYLRIYKVCTGSLENQYALRGEAMNREYAIKVVDETHDYWKQLLDKGSRTV